MDSIQERVIAIVLMTMLFGQGKKIQISQRLTWFLYEYAIQASFEIRDVFRELKSKKVFRAFLVTILDVLV